MAKNYNYYVIIGDNGYGMSQDWSDILQAAKYLRNEWHRGFQTEEEGYEYIKEQSMMRYALRSAGICDIDTLCAQKIVLLEDPEAAEAPKAPIATGRASRTLGGRCKASHSFVRPVICKGTSLAEYLAQDAEEDAPADKQQKEKADLYKAFEAWYSDHMQEKK